MVQLGSGITTIQLSAANSSNPFIPTILWDDQDVILIDTGIPGQLELIRAAFQELSIPFEKLSKIIITHQDMDHIGSLPALVQALGDQVQVLAHETAVAILTGETPLVKSKNSPRPSRSTSRCKTEIFYRLLAASESSIHQVIRRIIPLIIIFRAKP